MRKTNKAALRNQLQKLIYQIVNKVPELDPIFEKQAQDLRLPKTFSQWPPNITLPMMLMRENLQQSIFQSISAVQAPQSPYFDLSKLPKPKAFKIPVDSNGSHVCPDCGRIYKLKSSLRNHQKWECGKEPQFKCPFCSYRAKQKMHMLRHTERMHKGMDFSAIKKEMGADDEGHVGLETSDNDEAKDLSLKGAASGGGEGKFGTEEGGSGFETHSGASK
ncbi:zinc finger protein 449-like [Sitophilus oryzae]|uniref:Zinc finger protein 449-like n=1 Tax=Sitophilus oryzae TaxID=7048 RepID=A0A6J2YR92_SITOR|nr:zinc finger protein 449-like [Sitophilus oryzae]